MANPPDNEFTRDCEVPSVSMGGKQALQSEDLHFNWSSLLAPSFTIKIWHAPVWRAPPMKMGFGVPPSGGAG
jgi:hypothetical protein